MPRPTTNTEYGKRVSNALDQSGGSEAFGHAVSLAAPHLVTHI